MDRNSFYAANAHASCTENQIASYLYVRSVKSGYEFPSPNGLFKAVQFSSERSGFGPFIESLTISPRDGRLFALNFIGFDELGNSDRIMKKGNVGFMSRDSLKSDRIMSSAYPEKYFSGIQLDVTTDDLIIPDSVEHKLLVADSITGTVKDTFCRLSPSKMVQTVHDIALSSDGKVAFISGINFDDGNGEIWACYKGQDPVLVSKSTSAFFYAIELSFDEKFLFVSQSTSGKNFEIVQIGLDIIPSAKSIKVTSFDILINFNSADNSGMSGAYSMRADNNGNLWVSRNGEGRIDQLSIASKSIIRSVPVSMLYPTGISFGGYDGTLLYVVGRCGAHPWGSGAGCIDVFRTQFPGRTMSALTSPIPSRSPSSKPTLSPSQELIKPSKEGLYYPVLFPDEQSFFDRGISALAVSSLDGRVFYVPSQNGPINFLSREGSGPGTFSGHSDVDISLLQVDTLSGDILAFDKKLQKLAIYDSVTRNGKETFCEFSSIDGEIFVSDFAISRSGNIAFFSGNGVWFCFKGYSPQKLSAIPFQTSGIDITIDEESLYITKAAQCEVHRLKMRIHSTAASVEVLSSNLLRSKKCNPYSNGKGYGKVKLDFRENLWIVREDSNAIDRISSRDGSFIQSVQFSMISPLNFAFGGYDGTIMYVGGFCLGSERSRLGCIAVFRTNYPGSAYVKSQNRTVSIAPTKSSNSNSPSEFATKEPSSAQPTRNPTTRIPSNAPTILDIETGKPTKSPFSQPSAAPSNGFTETLRPTPRKTETPSIYPTESSSFTILPTQSPSAVIDPTMSPVVVLPPTSLLPSKAPSHATTPSSTATFTSMPSRNPSVAPHFSSPDPSQFPTSTAPSSNPPSPTSNVPSKYQTALPTIFSGILSKSPTNSPVASPNKSKSSTPAFSSPSSIIQSESPTKYQTAFPTVSPVIPSNSPTKSPITPPTKSIVPTFSSPSSNEQSGSPSKSRSSPMPTVSQVITPTFSSKPTTEPPTRSISRAPTSITTPPSGDVLYVSSPYGPTSSGFGTYIEGIAYSFRNGRLYGNNHRAGRKGVNDFTRLGTVGYISADGTDSVMFKNFQRANTHISSLQFDPISGNVLLTDVGNHRVLVFDTATGQEVDLFCDMSSETSKETPYDLTLSDDGEIAFFSGLELSSGTGELWACFKKKAPINLSSFVTNSVSGIQLSLDENALYLSQFYPNSPSMQSQIVELGIEISRSEQSIKVMGQKILIDFDEIDGSGNAGVDGMRLDTNSNLWAVRNGIGRIDCISTKSNKITRSVSTSIKYPTAIAFGGNDGKTVFIAGRCNSSPFGTGDGCIESFRSEYPGKNFRAYQYQNQQQQLN
jgi:sugar lactone lactonase YvrE